MSTWCSPGGPRKSRFLEPSDRGPSCGIFASPGRPPVRSEVVTGRNMNPRLATMAVPYTQVQYVYRCISYSKCVQSSNLCDTHTHNTTSQLILLSRWFCRITSADIEARIYQRLSSIGPAGLPRFLMKPHATSRRVSLATKEWARKALGTAGRTWQELPTCPDFSGPTASTASL